MCYENCILPSPSCRDSCCSPWPGILNVIWSDWLHLHAESTKLEISDFCFYHEHERKTKGSEGERKTHVQTDWHFLQYVSPNCFGTWFSRAKVQLCFSGILCTLVGARFWGSLTPVQGFGKRMVVKVWEVKLMNNRSTCLTFLKPNKASLANLIQRCLLRRQNVIRVVCLKGKDDQWG